MVDGLDPSVEIEAPSPEREGLKNTVDDTLPEGALDPGTREALRDDVIKPTELAAKVLEQPGTNVLLNSAAAPGVQIEFAGRARDLALRFGNEIGTFFHNTAEWAAKVAHDKLKDLGLI